METSSTTSTKSTTIASCLRALMFCLSRSRFSVIILFVGLGLLLTDQGRDLLIAYAEDHKMLIVAFAATLWALSIWGWCRLLLDIQYDDPPSDVRCYNFFRKWVPRCLGALAFIALALGSLQADQLILALYAFVALIVYLVFVIYRRPSSRKVAKVFSASKRLKLKSLAKAVETDDIEAESLPPYADLKEAFGISGRRGLLPDNKLKFRPFIILAMFLSFFLLAFLGNFAPVFLGSRLGAIILFFVWAATWLPLGSVMSYFADRRGIPLLSLLFVLSLIFSFNNDNHEIRKATGNVAVDSRKNVSQAMETWMEINKVSNKDRTPFVIVATAGGGIRAAYWTVTVLGDLQDQSAKFTQRTFALSGVSGGSVGATVYRALLDVPADTIKEKCPGGIANCAQRVLDEDFLGPVVAAMLYPDIAQRFWPIAMFPDRSAALEKSWERAFRKVTGDDRLKSSIGSLSLQPWRPSLFLNATWVDNGRRIVASNLRYAKAKEDSDEADIFIRSNDQLAVLGYDLRLSTAAHNSARFPFVSPPGMWQRDGKIIGRLQDGGLFENYGAETALEILDLACRKYACDLDPTTTDSKGKTKRIMPVVILISSDPSLPKDLAESPPMTPITFAYEMRTVLRAYERARGGRGAEAATRLREWTELYDGKYFQFRMCDTNGETDPPPLGWALSDSAKGVIKSYLFGAGEGNAKNPPCYEENAAVSRELKKLLENGSIQK